MALGKILFDDKTGHWMKALRKRWEGLASLSVTPWAEGIYWTLDQFRAEER